MYMSRHSIVFTEVLSFHAKKMKIRKLIKKFHELESPVENKYKRKCDKIILSMRVVFLTAGTILICSNVFYYKKVQIFIPTLYDDQADYEWFSFVYLIHVIHSFTYVFGVLAVELLPVISILKFEGLIEQLCEKIKAVTCGNSLENEKYLDECIKFHVDLIK